MILFFGLTYAFMAYILFVIVDHFYCNWYNKELNAGIKNPKLNFLKTLPARIKKYWLDYVEYVDQTFPGR